MFFCSQLRKKITSVIIFDWIEHKLPSEVMLLKYSYFLMRKNAAKKEEENYFTKHTNSSMSSKTVKWGYVIKIFRVLMEKKDGNYFTKLLMSSETAKLEIMLLKYSDVWWQKTWKLFCNIIDELRNLKYIMKFSMSPKHEYFYEVNFLGWVL